MMMTVRMSFPSKSKTLSSPRGEIRITFNDAASADMTAMMRSVATNSFIFFLVRSLNGLQRFKGLQGINQGGSANSSTYLCEVGLLTDEEPLAGPCLLRSWDVLTMSCYWFPTRYFLLSLLHLGWRLYDSCRGTQPHYYPPDAPGNPPTHQPNYYYTINSTITQPRPTHLVVATGCCSTPLSRIPKCHFWGMWRIGHLKCFDFNSDSVFVDWCDKRKSYSHLREPAKYCLTDFLR